MEPSKIPPELKSKPRSKADPADTMIEMAVIVDMRGCVGEWFSDIEDGLQWVDIKYILDSAGQVASRHVSNIRLACIRHLGQGQMSDGQGQNVGNSCHDVDGYSLCDQTFTDFAKLPIGPDRQSIKQNTQCVPASTPCRENGSSCYARLLRVARERLSWTEASFRSVLVIGDASMRDVCTDDCDWTAEAEIIKTNLNARIHVVPCGSIFEQNAFFNNVSDTTSANYLSFDQSSASILDVVVEMCKRENEARTNFVEKQMMEKQKKLEERKSRKQEERALLKISALESDLLDVNGESSNDDATPPGDMNGNHINCENIIDEVVEDASEKQSPKKRKGSLNGGAPVSVKRKEETKSKCSKFAKNREDCKVAENVIAQSQWSSWQLALSRLKPKDGGKWEKCAKLSLGYRNISLFAETKHLPAMYEVAVSPAESNRKYVVYYRTTSGLNMRTDSFLFQIGHVIEQTNYLLKNKCDIYVRKTPIGNKTWTNNPAKAKEELAKLDGIVMKSFDYAWCKHGYGRGRHRNVKKASVLISGDTF